MLNSSCEISIVVPVYSRLEELRQLLDSVLKQVEKPKEVILVEDCSPERKEISEVVASYKSEFLAQNIMLRYYENEINLGYDKNLRKAIELANTKWALILGNDDLLMPDAVQKVITYTSENEVDFISRTFLRFNDDASSPIGRSSFSSEDVIVKPSSSDSSVIFRLAGFVGGLIVNVDFCRRISTDKYDGTLYYQIYLAVEAYCNNGIGYIASPIICGRCDNPPLFGNSDDDKDVHLPGSYTPKGRAKMWRGVLKIISDADKKYGFNLLPSVKKELMVRQSFHVFEMNAGQTRATLHELKKELVSLGLFTHFVPKNFYMINYIFLSKSVIFYRIIRRLFQ